MATLYIVGTPIGNLEDITLRALDILKKADIIAAEDTRHTRILLDRYSIKTPLTSYHKFNIKEKTKQIISIIKSGKDIALVSDAGMPGISDPGYELISEAIKNDISVVPIPNTSALLVALSASGMNTDRFVFEGFLPASGGERRDRLEQLRSETRTIVIYEAPHRIVKTLNDINDHLGDRYICVARELTKKFEEFSRGRITELIDKYSRSKPKGEFVIVIEGMSEEKEKNPEELKALVATLMRSGMSRKDAVKIASDHGKVPKNKLYKLALDI